MIPNLLIAGAPKCGTSSLFNWLNAHPEICGSSKKELFYFMDRDNPLKNDQCNVHEHRAEDYQSYFAHAQDESFFMEGTTHYLFQDTAINYFAEQQEKPIVIFVLRDPAQRVYSSFNYTQNNLGRLDKSISFSLFVDSILQGREETLKVHFHSEKSEYVLQRDIEYSNYVKYLEKWSQAVGEQNMHIILFEEMKKKPATIIKNICDNIGIDSSFYEGFDFEKKNQTYVLRSALLQRISKKINRSLGTLPLKETLKGVYYLVQRKVPAGKTASDKKALEKLDEYFAESKQDMVKKFNVNVACWD